MRNLSKEEWKKAIAEDQNAVILDVRTPGECEEGIQPNAIQLNFLDGGAFMAEVEKLDPSKHYYIYCRSGGRSSAACGALESKGFASTFNLLGGMMAWDGEIV